MDKNTLADYQIKDETWQDYFFLEIAKCILEYKKYGVDSGFAEKREREIKNIEDLLCKYGQWQRQDYK